MKIIPQKNENGFATIVFISLLAIMVMLAAANTAALIHLHREVKLLEQQQIKRLNGPSADSRPVGNLSAVNNPSK